MYIKILDLIVILINNETLQNKFNNNIQEDDFDN